VSEYSLAIRASVAKDLDALPDPVFDRVDPKIRSLAKDPRPKGCTKLKGRKGLWRIRLGDYRVIYEIDDSACRVTVVRVAHRSAVYDR